MDIRKTKVDVGIKSPCEHVYLHVDRRFHRWENGAGLVPFWKCGLKRKNLEGVCSELSRVGLETACHPEECALAAQHMPWERCPFYSPRT